MRRSWIVVAVLFAATGCASSRRVDTNPLRPDRTRITAAELASSGNQFSNLYDYVQSRHSDWLQTRAITAIGAFDLHIYVDGQRFGSDPSAMHQIPLAVIALARRLSASEAAVKYGNDNNAGAIEVWTSMDRVR